MFRLIIVSGSVRPLLMAVACGRPANATIKVEQQTILYHELAISICHAPDVIHRINAPRPFLLVNALVLIVKKSQTVKLKRTGNETDQKLGTGIKGKFPPSIQGPGNAKFTFAICSPPQHETRMALSTYSWDVEKAVESIFS